MLAQIPDFLSYVPLLGQVDFGPGDDPNLNGGGGGLIAAVINLITLAIVVLVVVGFWKVFTKAGKPGWAAVIPIYNAIVLLEIAGKPIWWIILFLIPCVNFVVAFLVAMDIAKAFGKGAGFGIGLFLLPFIFYPLLGFSDAQYTPPASAV